MCPFKVCNFDPAATSQTMMLASCEADTRISLPFNVNVMTALTKSLWPWKRLAVLRVDSVHDQIDLSQHPANNVSDLGETATDVRGAVGPENVAATLLVYRRTCQWLMPRAM